MLFPEEVVENLYNIIFNNFMELSENQNGLCVIKKVIANTRNQKRKEFILMTIIDNFNNLIQNAYGNYTIQTVVEVISI